MSRSRRTERKVLRSLITFIDEEKAHLLKLRILAWGLSIGGGFLAGIALIPAKSSEGSDVLFLGIGMLAGILLGLSVLYHASVAQLPIVRRFLNVEAIRKAYDRGP